ncbi:MAG: YbgC/FadM family acyl-CoA thioesterase [Candidatus Omnitrophica bacterium]|nr:YbgC/FadM family acyl-CoA thioesterase [Candidatus Omnitrophota bacterium]MBD3269313.1 YbgC/FadM family acyl-CoA thioesterase [Candidatus Omnitrophota bacterium]
MAHRLRRKIYYHDTDAGGVVYYANYLKHFEEARTEFLADNGVDINMLMQKGIWFVVKGIEVNYRKPARYSDLIDISTGITKLKHVSIDFLQEARKGDELLVSARTVLVCVDSGFRACQIPEEVEECLRK